MPPPVGAATGTTETLAGLVEQHALNRPDDIAIRYGDEQWSWLATNAREPWILRMRYPATPAARFSKPLCGNPIGRTTREGSDG